VGWEGLLEAGGDGWASGVQGLVLGTSVADGQDHGLEYLAIYLLDYFCFVADFYFPAVLDSPKESQAGHDTIAGELPYAARGVADFADLANGEDDVGAKA